MGYVVLNITSVSINWRQGMITAGAENSVFIQYLISYSTLFRSRNCLIKLIAIHFEIIYINKCQIIYECN